MKTMSRAKIALFGIIGVAIPVGLALVVYMASAGTFDASAQTVDLPSDEPTNEATHTPSPSVTPEGCRDDDDGTPDQGSGDAPGTPRHQDCDDRDDRDGDNSGPGNAEDRGDDDGHDDNSGPGSGGDDDSSGHGSGGDDDSSGSGSSGSGGDDSSGHGSGDDD